MNFQLIKTPNGSYYDYECIGSWDSGNLTMVDDAKIFWPNPDGTKMTEPIESVCSKPCEKGKVKVSNHCKHLYNISAIVDYM